MLEENLREQTILFAPYFYVCEYRVHVKYGVNVAFKRSANESVESILKHGATDLVEIFSYKILFFA